MLALALAAAVLLIIGELTRLSYRTIGQGACDERINPDICTTTGADAHHYVLWVIAVALLAFAFGAAVGRSRPAAVAAMACGVATLFIALVLDLPDLDDTRGIEALYNNAEGHIGTAFWLELIGGALAVAAGALAFRIQPRR